MGGRTMGEEALSRFPSIWAPEYESPVVRTGLDLLAAMDPRELVSILEEHLCTALRIEGEAIGDPQFATISWWRTAIEPTDQDHVRSYKDWLLETLRDSLEVWVEQDAPSVGTFVHRYLGQDTSILRRLGLHQRWAGCDGPVHREDQPRQPRPI